MSVLSSLAGAPFVTGKRSKSPVSRSSGQRTDGARSQGSKATQEFALEEIAVNTRRSPAGFGFDLNALLDDGPESKQPSGTKMNSSNQAAVQSNSKLPKESSGGGIQEQRNVSIPVQSLRSHSTQDAMADEQSLAHSGSSDVQVTQALPAGDSVPSAQAKFSAVDEGADLLDIIGAFNKQTTGVRRAALAGRRASSGLHAASAAQPPTLLPRNKLEASTSSSASENVMASHNADGESGAALSNTSLQPVASVTQPGSSHGAAAEQLAGADRALFSSALTSSSSDASSLQAAPGTAAAASQSALGQQLPSLPLPHPPPAPHSSAHVPASRDGNQVAFYTETSQVRDAETKLSSAHVELDVAKTQVKVLQQKLAQQAGLHSAELDQRASELQHVKSALAAAQAQSSKLQAELDSMQKQMAAVSLDKQDLQQASKLQEQFQKALQDQQQLSSRLHVEWQQQEQSLMSREGRLEQREQAAQSLQSDALSLKAELQRLADAMQAEAERQSRGAAEEKQALARHQARLDTLQAVMADELGQVRMQLQLEKEALERARTQRAADRDTWFQQVSNEQKQLAQETAQSHKSLEAARVAELAARKAALEIEAQAKLASKEADELEVRLRELRNKVASEQGGYESAQHSLAAEKEVIARQASALVDMGKQIQAKSEAVATAGQAVDAHRSDVAKQQAMLAEQSNSLQEQSREVQQQLRAVHDAQAQVWAQRSQLAVEQQAAAEDKAQAVQQAQEAAAVHAKLLGQLKHTQAQGVLESTRRVLAAVQNKRTPVQSWSARQETRRASMSPESIRSALGKAACSASGGSQGGASKWLLPGKYTQTAAGLEASTQPRQHDTFIKTVPMQHVQSHYAELQLDKTSYGQTHASVQRVSPAQASWPRSLSTSAFVPLVPLSPESSCSSVCQDELQHTEACKASC